MNLFNTKVKFLKSGLLVLVLCLSMVLTSCTSLKTAFQDFLNEDGDVSLTVSTDAPDEPEERKEIAKDDAETLAVEYLSTLSEDEKIGQLFSVNLELLDTSKGSFYEHRKITKEMKENLEKYNVGGVILFTRNIYKRKQTERLISKLQKNSKIPLFVMVDEEGGRVARISSNTEMGTTFFDSPEYIGENYDADYTYDMGQTIGSEISEIGFNVDLAPVADVRTSDLNVEIGDRSFGSDPEEVSEYVKNFVLGMQDENVSACLKHFPGQGASEGDTHVTGVDVDRNISELRENEFLPFTAGIEEGNADFVMVSHISVSKVTETNEPASMSDLMMKTILRDELGFKGVVITDAFDMNSITDYYTTEEAVVEAIDSGADIVLMPHSLEDAFNAVKDALADGTITMEQIDQSLTRILTVKLMRGIIPVTNE